MKIWNFVKVCICSNDDDCVEVMSFNNLKDCKNKMKEIYNFDIDENNLGDDEELDDESYLDEFDGLIKINDDYDGYRILYKIEECEIK